LVLLFAADPPNPLWPKSPTQLAPKMKAPVLGLYGEADTGIPVAQVEALKAALAAASKPADFKIYPGAPHGFHADYRASYRKEAAEDGWSRMQAWFNKYNAWAEAPLQGQGPFAQNLLIRRDIYAATSETLA
jgi:carboxymethylenebutenolidase